MVGKIKLSDSALTLVDLKTSAESEAESYSGFVPKGVIERVLKGNSKELEIIINSQMKAGIQIPIPEVLLASKAVRGNRPFAVLDVTQRVLYNGLTSALQKDLPPLHRGGELFEEFKLAPLNHSSKGYVVMTDVAACYQYIDHELLESELLAQTSETEITECIISFLGALSQRSCGLPQGRLGSHILAEVVLDIAERKLLRDGAAVWRYSDDFRIHAENQSEAQRSLELLEHQLRKMGLVLSEEKTSVRTHAEYESWAHAASKQIESVGEEVELDLTVLDQYENEYPPDDVDVSVEQATRLLSYWVDGIRDKKSQFGPDTVINRRLFKYALWILRGLREDEGISKTKFILEHEPSFTPDVMNYLLEVTTQYEDSVTLVLDEVVGDPDFYLSDWQKVWLLQPMKKVSELSTTQIGWVREQFKSQSGIVSSESAIVLAKHTLVDVDTLLHKFNLCDEGSRPQLVEAITITAGSASDKKVRAVTRDRPLYGWIAEEVLKN